MWTNALHNLRNRRNPEGFVENFSGIREDDAVVYLVAAMEPVGATYTTKTYEEGNRVAKQISTGLAQHSLTAEYEYQGSVKKNTHIKAYSDVDLLVIETRFSILEPPQIPSNPYKGDPTQDLIQIRRICTSHLKSAFPQATVDDSGARSVKISGGSLQRTVDVVPANWFNTNDYATHKNQFFRGVHVLNSHTLMREPDYPFLHSGFISLKDKNTNGNARKLIRLLKSLKYDSDG
jgi:hypothetical protein